MSEDFVGEMADMISVVKTKVCGSYLAAEGGDSSDHPVWLAND